MYLNERQVFAKMPEKRDIYIFLFTRTPDIFNYFHQISLYSKFKENVKRKNCFY